MIDMEPMQHVDIMADAVDRHTKGLREHVHGHHVGAGETMEYLVGKA